MNSSSQKHVYPWYESLFAKLVEARRNQRLSHALLVSGPANIGKLEFVDCFASHLMCQHNQEHRVGACGSCKSCVLFKSGTHPDYRVLAPEGAGKAITVDSIRALYDFVSITSQQGGVKVVKIEAADALNENAANALLKMLEEPPGDTCFLLVTNSEGQILSTIRSRCYPLRISMPSRATVEAWLSSLYPQRDDIEALIEQAGGVPLLAARLADGEKHVEHSLLQAQIRKLIDDEQTVSELAQVLSESDAVTVIDQLIHLASRAAKKRSESGPDTTERMSRVTSTDWIRLLDELIFARRLLIGQTNPNPQLLMESLLISWKNLGY